MDWQTCICQVLVHVQVCYSRSSSCNSDAPDDNHPCRAICNVSDSDHAGQPSPPDGGLVIEPSGCRGRLGSSKSHPLALVANAVDVE
eukprot:1231454-Pyramimonas_sp.AAC.1